MIYNKEERKLPTVTYFGNKHPYIYQYFRFMSSMVLDAFLDDYLKGAERHLPIGTYLSNAIVPGETLMCRSIVTMPLLTGYGITHRGDIFRIYSAEMQKTDNSIRSYRKTYNDSFASRIATVSFGNSYRQLVALRDIYNRELIVDSAELTFREFFGYQIIERLRDEFNDYLSLAYEDADDFDYSEVGLYLQPCARRTYDRLSFFEEPDVW